MNTIQEQNLNALRSEPVHVNYELDSGPGRYRIGLLALSNDLATERDFINMRSSDDIAIFVSRIPNAEICSVENLRAMEPELTRAVSLLIPGSRLDAVAYSCTSGTVVLGYDAVVRRIHEERPGIPVATPITAALAAFRLLGARTISVLTPYTDDVNVRIANYLLNSGLEIAAFSSFHHADNDAMAKTPPQAILDAALEADRPDADALFISCTAIRAVDVLESIEQAIGKPVVSANQALYWQALRAAGYQQPVEGYGYLLRTVSGGEPNDRATETGERMR